MADDYGDRNPAKPHVEAVPGASEFSWGPGLEPLDPATGQPYPVSQGGRYRGVAPGPGVPDNRADPGQLLAR